MPLAMHALAEFVHFSAEVAHVVLSSLDDPSWRDQRWLDGSPANSSATEEVRRSEDEPDPPADSGGVDVAGRPGSAPGCGIAVPVDAGSDPGETFGDDPGGQEAPGAAPIGGGGGGGGAPGGTSSGGPPVGGAPGGGFSQ